MLVRVDDGQLMRSRFVPYVCQRGGSSFIATDRSVSVQLLQFHRRWSLRAFPSGGDASPAACVDRLQVVVLMMRQLLDLWTRRLAACVYSLCGART